MITVPVYYWLHVFFTIASHCNGDITEIYRRFPIMHLIISVKYFIDVYLD